MKLEERALEPTTPRRSLGVAVLGALLAVLVPKCPLCLATYLSFVGAAATGLVYLRPLGVALMLTGLAVATSSMIRLRRRPKRSRQAGG
jgi:hypothetical protein